MATERGVEYNQAFLNVPGPSTSQSAERGARIAESQGRLVPKQRVEVTVLWAVNVPNIKKFPFLKRNVFVTVSNGETTVAKTADVPVEGQMAKWNQSLDPFFVQPSSYLTFWLYAKRSSHPDIPVGTYQMQIPLASQNDIPCVLENDVGGTARSTQRVTLYITVNTKPPILYSSPPSISTEDDGSPGEEAPIPGRIQSPSPERPSPLSHHQPVEADNNKPQSRAEAPASTNDLRLALDQADRAMKEIDRSNTWQGAVGRLKWLMDTLSPVAELFPLAKMAHNLLLRIPETLLKQYQNDHNVQTLLRAIRYAFDFADHEDTLLIKSIKPQSKQAQILAQMLEDVGTCCDFIQSYAKDSEFWKRTLKNIVDGPEDKINELSNVLVKHRTAFLDRATISTQITAFQILDDVARISTQLSNVELDAIIREIPRGVNSRFSPSGKSVLWEKLTPACFLHNKFLIWFNTQNVTNSAK